MSSCGLQQIISLSIQLYSKVNTETAIQKAYDTAEHKSPQKIFRKYLEFNLFGDLKKLTCT